MNFALYTSRLAASSLTIVVLTSSLLLICQHLDNVYTAVVPPSVGVTYNVLRRVSNASALRKIGMTCLHGFLFGFLGFILCAGFIKLATFASGGVSATSEMGILTISAIADIGLPIAVGMAVINLAVFFWEVEGEAEAPSVPQSQVPPTIKVDETPSPQVEAIHVSLETNNASNSQVQIVPVPADDNV